MDMEVDEQYEPAGWCFNDGDAISEVLLAQVCESVNLEPEPNEPKGRLPLADRTPAYVCVIQAVTVQPGKAGACQLGRSNSLLGPGQASPKPPLGRPPLSPSTRPAGTALFGPGSASKVQPQLQQGFYPQDPNRSPTAAGPSWAQGLSVDSPTRARSQPQSPGTTLASVLLSAQGAQTQAALRSPGTAKRGLSFR